jgi:hypothetical protein
VVLTAFDLLHDKEKKGSIKKIMICPKMLDLIRVVQGLLKTDRIL